MPNEIINTTSGGILATAEAFAGVNYIETLATKGATAKVGFNELTNLLEPDPGIGGFLQHNVSSIFNKFSVFQYSALNAGSRYRQEGHFIGFSSNLKKDTEYESSSIAPMILKRAILEKIENGGPSTTTEEKAKAKLDLLNLNQGIGALQQQARNFKSNIENTLSNPTGKLLIEWGANKSAGSPVGFQPYSLTDFMFCKDYGKIPNNRLVTLRRYPFPVADSLRLGQTDRRRNALPVAQAVTWFGSDTGNSLSNIGVFKWDMTFQEIEVNEQIVTGNEVTLTKLLELVAGATGKAGQNIKDTLLAAYAATTGTDAAIQEVSGFDEKMQLYQRNLYDSTSGPYWNRIYGPVNVIHKSSRRTRGMQNGNWNTPFTLNFRYSFRSFNGMSPKIVALDLISNFINLTYNDAQFLGQLARYFPKTGLKMSPSTTEAFGKILTSWGTTYSGNNSDQFSTILQSMHDALEKVGSDIQNDTTNLIGRGLQTGLMSPSVLGKAIPELISVKAALSDRPIGEWHIVVGNPLNPIFVMGDLVCSSVEMKWDDELGPDDFPTGVSFAVTLKQGKPRDKTAIERMLNLGETKLTSGALRTSSADDTFGEANNKAWNEIQATAAGEKGNQTETLNKFYDNLKLNEKSGGTQRYDSFRNRFLTGYGIPDPKKSTDSTISSIDDSLLLFYYQRQYGQN